MEWGGNRSFLTHLAMVVLGMPKEATLSCEAVLTTVPLSRPVTFSHVHVHTKPHVGTVTWCFRPAEQSHPSSLEKRFMSLGILFCFVSGPV